MTYNIHLMPMFKFPLGNRGHHGRDRDHMVVRFTTTCAISAYHH